MASINGLTIRNEVTFLGHEGYATQGDIFLGDEKIAFWSQDGNGGQDTIYMEDKFSESKLFNTLKELNKEKPIILEYHGEKKEIDFNMEFFMGDLLELQDLEKEYTKYRSKGYYLMITVSNYYMRSILPLKKEFLSIKDDDIMKIIQPKVEEFKQQHGSEGIKTEIFRDYKDFNIGVTINKADIYNFQKLKDVWKWEKLVLNDRMISKEEFNNFDESTKQELLEKDVISSNKNYVYYEKDYFLSISQNTKTKEEIELDK